MLMPQIFLDGESVEFEGALPESASELRQILSDHLLNNGRVLISFKVDNEEVLELPQNKHPASFNRVEATSVSQGIAIVQMVDEVLQEHGALPNDMHHLASTLLIYPWTQTKPQISEAIKDLAPIIEVMSYLVGFGSAQKPSPGWHLNGQNIVATFPPLLDKLATYIDHEDVGGISELLDLYIAPLVEKSFQSMSECVQATFPMDKKLENN